MNRNGNISEKRFGKTINLNDSHNGLNRLISMNPNSNTFRASKPRYAGNEDVFQQVPYTQAKINTSRNNISMNSSNAESLRPSPWFLTLNRDLQKQNIYSDQYDGPSSLITISPDRKRDVIKASKMKNPYQAEREEFKRSTSKIREVSENGTSSPLLPDIGRKSVALPEWASLLKSSKQQYSDFLKEKQALREFQDWKQTKNYINKRDRLLKNSWRHGVIGVENPLDPDSEVYNDIHQNKLIEQKNKDIINNRRMKNLVKYTNTSSQINFGIEPKFARLEEKKIVELDHQWKSKRSSPERLKIALRISLCLIFLPKKKRWEREDSMFKSNWVESEQK